MKANEENCSVAQVVPYFDVLLKRLDAGERRACTAFGRHVHWGYWTEPNAAQLTPEDYAIAAERLCRKICDAAEVRDGMRVLDVGCGLGGTIASINERCCGMDLVGVNIDPRQLERAERTVFPLNGNRIRFVEADACALPFEPASFDAVLAVECIFHFPSRAAFLAQAARVLVAGGSLALSDFIPPRDAVATLKQLGAAHGEETRLSYGAVDLTCPLEDYDRMAEQVGLTLMASEDVTAHTLPTYLYLKEDQRHWPEPTIARIHQRATTRLQGASLAGLLQYTIVRFRRLRSADESRLEAQRAEM